MKPITRAILLPLTVVFVGCSGVAPVSSSTPGRNVITAEEISTTTATTALDLVRRLRPQWLRARGQVSFSRQPSVVVYLDGMRTGGPGILGDIEVENLREIRYLTGTEATQRFGTDHGEGAILVTLR